MKFCSFLSILTFSILLANAQEFADQNLQSLVNAERAFSKMAKEKSTREAFLTFFADNAVTSAPGKGPRIGKKHLEEQPANESWLYWEPIYSDIASSGDFGFNTGPWEFRQSRNDEKPIAFGDFVSIWKKNLQDEWKVVVDIGIAHPQAAEKTASTTSSMKLYPPKKIVGNSKKRLLEVEKKFIGDFIQNGNSAYAAVRSREARFYRTGNLPYVSEAIVEKLLNEPSPKITYTLMDGEVSSSDDLAYVYGKTSYETTKDGVTQSREGTYMRFWKKEDGQHWKIVLDLLTN
jgi:ketosteroid isomerase-like protein